MIGQGDTEAIADELYKLNNNIQSLILILCEINGKPLEYISDDGFKFKEQQK